MINQLQSPRGAQFFTTDNKIASGLTVSFIVCMLMAIKLDNSFLWVGLGVLCSTILLTFLTLFMSNPLKGLPTAGKAIVIIFANLLIILPGLFVAVLCILVHFGSETAVKIFYLIP